MIPDDWRCGRPLWFLPRERTTPCACWRCPSESNTSSHQLEQFYFSLNPIYCTAVLFRFWKLIFHAGKVNFHKTAWKILWMIYIFIKFILITNAYLCSRNINFQRSLGLPSSKLSIFPLSITLRPLVSIRYPTSPLSNFLHSPLPLSFLSPKTQLLFLALMTLSLPLGSPSSRMASLSLLMIPFPHRSFPRVSSFTLVSSSLSLRSFFIAYHSLSLSIAKAAGSCFSRMASSLKTFPTNTFSPSLFDITIYSSTLHLHNFPCNVTKRA